VESLAEEYKAAESPECVAQHAPCALAVLTPSTPPATSATAPHERDDRYIAALDHGMHLVLRRLLRSFDPGRVRATVQSIECFITHEAGRTTLSGIVRSIHGAALSDPRFGEWSAAPEKCRTAEAAMSRRHSSRHYALHYNALPRTTIRHWVAGSLSVRWSCSHRSSWRTEPRCCERRRAQLRFRSVRFSLMW